MLDLALGFGFLVYRRLHSATIFREIYAKIVLKSSIWEHMCIILVHFRGPLGYAGVILGVQGSTFYECEALMATAGRQGVTFLVLGGAGGP